jgi:hypothetical protein
MLPTFMERGIEMIVVKCSGCGVSLKIADEKAGHRVKCPKCQAVFRVPPLPAAPATLQVPAPQKAKSELDALAAAAQTASPSPARPVATPTVPPSTQSHQPHKTNNMKVLVIAAIAVVAALAGGVGVYFAMKDSSAKTNQEKTSGNATQQETRHPQVKPQVEPQVKRNETYADFAKICKQLDARLGKSFNFKEYIEKQGQLTDAYALIEGSSSLQTPAGKVIKDAEGLREIWNFMFSDFPDVRDKAERALPQYMTRLSVSINAFLEEYGKD